MAWYRAGLQAIYMDTLPLKIFNRDFTVCWLEFSELELTRRASSDSNYFLKLTRIFCPDYIVMYQRCQLSDK